MKIKGEVRLNSHIGKWTTAIPNEAAPEKSQEEEFTVPTPLKNFRRRIRGR